MDYLTHKDYAGKKSASLSAPCSTARRERRSSFKFLRTLQWIYGVKKSRLGGTPWREKEPPINSDKPFCYARKVGYGPSEREGVCALGKPIGKVGRCRPLFSQQPSQGIQGRLCAKPRECQMPPPLLLPLLGPECSCVVRYSVPTRRRVRNSAKVRPRRRPPSFFTHFFYIFLKVPARQLCLFSL